MPHRFYVIAAIVAAVFCISLSGKAADEKPTEESVKRLLEVIGAQNLVAQTGQQANAAIQAAQKHALENVKPTEGEQKILDDTRMNAVAMIDEAMKWETIEPMFIELYQNNFTQAEVDAMTTFSTSSAGRSYISKMPAVMQGAQEIIQQIMFPLMTKMQKMQMDEVEKLKALKTQP